MYGDLRGLIWPRLVALAGFGWRGLFRVWWWRSGGDLVGLSGALATAAGRAGPVVGRLAGHLVAVAGDLRASGGLGWVWLWVWVWRGSGGLWLALWGIFPRVNTPDVF